MAKIETLSDAREWIKGAWVMCGTMGEIGTKLMLATGARIHPIGVKIAKRLKCAIGEVEEAVEGLTPLKPAEVTAFSKVVAAFDEAVELLSPHVGHKSKVRTNAQATS